MKTLKFFLTFAAASFLLASTNAPAQTRETLAVGTVQTTSALTDDMARKGKSLEMRRVVESLDRHLITALAQSKKFSIVGRSDLKDLLKEQDLGDSGIVDAGTAAEKGKVKGAKYRLVTTVDNFLEENTDADFGNGRKMTKRRFQLSAQAIIYDAATSEVLDSSNVQVEKLDTLTVEPGQVSDAKRTDDLMPAVAKEFADRVTLRTVGAVFPAKIIDKEDKTVTINRGESTGIQVGEEWKVFGPSKTITDPDSGEVIKRKGTYVGKVKITSVESNYSQGEIIEDKGGVVTGSVLSPPQKAAN